MKKTVNIQIGGINPTHKFDTNIDLKTGDIVIVETPLGAEWGIVASEPIATKSKESNNMVLRIADEKDTKTINDLVKAGINALKTTSDRVEKYKLDMKPISAYYTLDGNKIIINFHSENRVDFRELVKDLAYSLRARIELKQVGAREEAKMVGALGPCGMECCCKRFLNNFDNVTIKMAKNQNIALNPQRINGMCGRLLCCLSYENDHYTKMQEKMPRYGSEVQTPDGKGVAQDNNIIKETVNVKFKNGDIFTTKPFPLCDINCKGKGNCHKHNK